MKTQLFEKIRLFLQKNLKDPKKPVLLGYSGGYDSKALLYLLIEYKKIYGLDLHLAHVDHKWRETSAQEALDLQKEAKNLKIPFHLKTLEEVATLKNKEAYYRNCRLDFFKELTKIHAFQAIILAHQQDDLSETVLKKILEGTDLFWLEGIKEKIEMDGLIILRPLLSITKKELILWLQKRDLIAIDDETNKDTKYLRSRIRYEILPKLSALFGKEIANNLVATSNRSLELRAYFDKRTQKFFDKREEGPFGLFLDFAEIFLEDLELKYLLKRLLKKAKVSPSRSCIDRIFNSLKTGKDFSLKLKEGLLVLEHKRFFVLSKELLFPIFFKIEGKLPLKEENEGFFCCYKNWHIKVEKKIKGDFSDKEPFYSSWKDVFKGKFQVILPQSEYYLIMPTGKVSYYKKSLTKWFSENKIPSFMRFSFPVIFKEDKMFYEFLSGKKRFKEQETVNYCKITFKLSCLN